ncbi:MAG: VanZ family protein [Phycisphaeraceae bacterium]|nr:VanZ family protein [Phycisphaeraceae bacterium]
MIGPSRRWRPVFWCYAGLVLVLTHWPGLAIEIPEIQRPDLVIHGAVFGTWTTLLGLSGYLGRRGNWSSLLATCGTATLYAALDEWTQQFVRRHTALDDFLANLVGVALGAIALWLLTIRAARSRPPPLPPQ